MSFNQFFIELSKILHLPDLNLKLVFEKRVCKHNLI